LPSLRSRLCIAWYLKTMWCMPQTHRITRLCDMNAWKGWSRPFERPLDANDCTWTSHRVQAINQYVPIHGTQWLFLTCIQKFASRAPLCRATYLHTL
jgi:hypothetical protein